MSECRAGSGGKLKQTLLYPKKSNVPAPSNSLRQNAIVIDDDEVTKQQPVAPLIQSSLVPLLPVSSSPLEALQRYFGHSSFRNGQEQVIQTVLKGVDSIAVFPTGAGKSLLFQLPSLMLPGLTVVVSPLIALMEDQVAQLSNRNIKALCIHSSLTAGARREIMAVLTQMTLPDQAVNTHLLYATPELLTSAEFQNEYLKPLYAQNKLSLFAIDEAHCVSTWGADFRPHYRRLDCLKRLFPRVPVLALTATATPRVRKDILTSLKIQNAKTFVGSFDRQNLYYEVRYKECINDLYQDIVSVINHLGRSLSSIRPVDIVNPSGIIYAPTRARVEQATEELSKRGILIESYHAGMNAANRQAVFKRWLSNETRVIASTVAFGMGIDKPDCRFVIHEGVPGSMENYYQESGRAGRDGLPSLALLYYSQRDKSRQIFFARGKIASAASDGDASVYTDAQSDEGVVPLFQPMITFCEPFSNKANKPCRRRLLLQHFSESERCSKAGDTCCDLCRDMSKAEASFRRSLEERNEEATERRVVNSLAASLRAKRGPQYASDSDGAEVDEYSNHRRTKQKGDPTFFDYSMEAAQEEHDDESSHGHEFHGMSQFKLASQAPARLPPTLLNAAVKDDKWRNKVFDAMEKAESRAEQREKVSSSRSSLLSGFAKAPSSAVMRPFRPPAPLQPNPVKPASTAADYPLTEKLLEPLYQVPGGVSVQERSRVFNLLCDALRSAGIESADAERIVANNELRVLKECKDRSEYNPKIRELLALARAKQLS